ncbi:hypothetical protein [Nodularia sp. UHCC 0506]|uniref:hypothetical protein n=1 Tax=Nodularia sp. UHCC 0506 TaxID=3110243 RepID=UPI002B1E922C|nr:hypothetical protein [Nodularia sp. UHCC 0506]MEA5516396.1 hypothetical protein [Nodularia sp. UHCC 0506]
MKLSRILPLVVGSGAAGVLAGTSPAQALRWTANNIIFDDGGTLTGSFDFENGTYSNIHLTLTGPAIEGGPGTTKGTITFDSEEQLLEGSNDYKLLLSHNGLDPSNSPTTFLSIQIEGWFYLAENKSFSSESDEIPIIGSYGSSQLITTTRSFFQLCCMK